MQGRVFNIQKFSIHDGPGIRTTVFLKGCPLRCQWCANPESQAFEKQVLHDASKCVGCKTCIQACPQDALKMVNGRIVHNPKACDGCLACIQACPNHALSMEGEDKSVQEVVDVCLQDLPFYEESGGGVTISGGEGMSQPDFAMALVDALSKEGIHCAIETTGCVEPAVFQTLAPKFDLLLFDVKHWSSAVHAKFTGQDNQRILENLSWAVENGCSVLVRIPVIPRFNASLQDAMQLADLLKARHVQNVQLLPFHQFGLNKYHQMQRDYLYENDKALYPEDLADYRQAFENAGLTCWF